MRNFFFIVVMSIMALNAQEKSNQTNKSAIQKFYDAATRKNKEDAKREKQNNILNILKLFPYEEVSFDFDKDINEPLGNIDGDIGEDSNIDVLVQKPLSIVIKHGEITFKKEYILDGQGSFYYRYMCNQKELDELEEDKKARAEARRKRQRGWWLLPNNNRKRLFTFKMKADDRIKNIRFDYLFTNMKGSGMLLVSVVLINYEEAYSAHFHSNNAYQHLIKYPGKEPKGTFEKKFKFDQYEHTGFDVNKDKVDYLFYIDIIPNGRLNDTVTVLIDKLEIVPVIEE